MILFKRQKTIYFILFFFITFLLLSSINQTFNSISGYDVKEETYMDNYDLISVFYSPDFQALYDNKIAAMKQAYNILSANESYFEIYYQYIEISDVFWGEKFVYGYEYGSTVSLPLESEHSTIPIYNIKAVQLSQNCLQQFQIAVKDGRPLLYEDMNYSSDRMMPVILGSDYGGIMNIGDQFEGMYLLKNLTFEVVGILEPNSSITIYDTPVYLDRYILMPMFNCLEKPSDSEEDAFQVRHYANKLSGIIFPSSDLSSKISELNKLDIGKFELSTTAISTQMFARIINSLNISSTSFSILLAITIIVVSPLLFTLFINKNFAIYVVMFLTGHKISKLRINVIAIFSVSILIALLLVCLCTLVIGIPFCRPTLYICIAMLIVEAIIIILSFSLKRILHWMGEMNVKSQKY